MPSSAQITSSDNFNVDRFIEGLLTDFSIEVQEVAKEAQTIHTTISQAISNGNVERPPQRRLVLWVDWEPPRLFRCPHSCAE